MSVNRRMATATLNYLWFRPEDRGDAVKSLIEEGLRAARFPAAFARRSIDESEGLRIKIESCLGYSGARGLDPDRAMLEYNTSADPDRYYTEMILAFIEHLWFFPQDRSPLLRSFLRTTMIAWGADVLQDHKYLGQHLIAAFNRASE